VNDRHPRIVVRVARQEDRQGHGNAGPLGRLLRRQLGSNQIVHDLFDGEPLDGRVFVSGRINGSKQRGREVTAVSVFVRAFPTCARDCEEVTLANIVRTS